MKDLADIINELPSLSETVNSNQLNAKKSLGQNFLLDINITLKIVRESLKAQRLKDFSKANVFEIGPGPGGLTRAILSNNPKKFTVIEMDKRCISIMEELKSRSGDIINIIEGDALKNDIHNIGEKPRHILSNLPYNISTQLLLKWLKDYQDFESFTLMFQKEVADRLTAKVGTKSYGRMSVITQLLSDVSKLFDLKPSCFTPAPKIMSSVVLIKLKKEHIDVKLIEAIQEITRLAFGQRRKMIKKSLKSIENINEKLAQTGITESLRAEDISPEQYLELSKLIIKN